MLFELFGKKTWENLSKSSVRDDDSGAFDALFFSLISL